MTNVVSQQQTNVAKQERPIDLFKSVINAPSVQTQFNNALGEHKDRIPDS